MCSSTHALVNGGARSEDTAGDPLDSMTLQDDVGSISLEQCLVLGHCFLCHSASAQIVVLPDAMSWSIGVADGCTFVDPQRNGGGWRLALQAGVFGR